MALWAHLRRNSRARFLDHSSKPKQLAPAPFQRSKCRSSSSEGRAHNRGRGRRRRLRARSKDLAGVVLTDGETVAPRGCRAQVAVTRPVAPCSNQIRDSREALSSSWPRTPSPRGRRTSPPRTPIEAVTATSARFWSDAASATSSSRTSWSPPNASSPPCTSRGSRLSSRTTAPRTSRARSPRLPRRWATPGTTRTSGRGSTRPCRGASRSSRPRWTSEGREPRGSRQPCTPPIPTPGPTRRERWTVRCAPPSARRPPR